MKEFLTDFYNKVVNFFQAEKVEGENSKVTAKNRLKLVLMQDRSNLEPETMAKLREELIEVISKYIVIDKESLGLNLDGDGQSMALMLNIPVLRAKTPEEIAEALAEAEKAKVVVKEETEEEAEEAEESEDTEENKEPDEEETVVEFSEGSVDEIECECSEDCKCGCKEGEPCTCEEECACGCEEDEEQPEATAEQETAEEQAEEKKTKKK